MKSSLSSVAPSAIAILPTTSLCGLSGTAVSQTASDAATLPTITVVAPRHVARPQRVARPLQRPTQAATIVSRPAAASSQTSPPAQGLVLAKIAALEKTSSNCTDGCQTSFKNGNQPWNGCSLAAGFSLSARAEIYAISEPTLNAAATESFWPGRILKPGGTAPACSLGGGLPTRTIRWPSDQDVGNRPYRPPPFLSDVRFG
jgi:hypothetical protein